jgi:hypothetical protein
LGKRPLQEIHDLIDVLVQHLLPEQVAVREEVQETLLRRLRLLQQVELVFLDLNDRRQQFNLILSHLILLQLKYLPPLSTIENSQTIMRK